MGRSKLHWILFPALTLTMPFASLADDVQTSLARDLTLAEAGQAIKGFAVRGVGEAPNEKLKVYGMLDARCASAIEIAPISWQDPDNRSRVLFGVRITDRGGGLECAKRSFNERCTNSSCVRLSDLPSSTIELAANKDGEAQLLQRDAEGDLVPVKAESFAPKVMHVGHETIAARQRAEAKAESDRISKVYRAQVTVCRKTRDDFQTAFSALEGLDGIGALREGELEKITRELHEKELLMICRDALDEKKTSDDELETIREEVLARSLDFPKRASLCMADISKRYKRNGNFEASKDTIEETKGIEGLSEQDLAVLDQAQHNLVYDEASAACAAGFQGNTACMNMLNSVAQNTMKSVQNGCYAQNASTELCSIAMKDYQTLQAIPVAARSADYGRCTRQIETNLQLAQMRGQQIQPQQRQAMLGQCGQDPQMQMGAGQFTQGQPGGMSTMPQQGMPQMMPGGMPVSNGLPGLAPFNG